MLRKIGFGIPEFLWVYIISKGLLFEKNESPGTGSSDGQVRF